MPIHHAVLGILAGGPSYGYELKTSFEQAIGPQWGELNIGHLYQVLDRLVRDGLVTRRDVAQRNRPDKVVYRLARAGHLELKRWLAEPLARQGGYRDDFFLKLFVAAWFGPDTVRDVVRSQREVYLAELSTLGELQRHHTDEPLVRLLIEAASLHTIANLRIAERADEQADILARARGTVADEAPVRAADEVGA